MKYDPGKSPTGDGEFALGLLVAVLGLAVAALPAALRVAGQGVSFVAAWLALWGSAALLIGPASGALRVARPLPPAAIAVLGGLLAATPVLTLLARVLKAQTHHRPLGAATFAMLAAIVVLGAIALLARLYAMTSRLPFLVVVAGAALASAALALPLLSVAGGSVLDALLALAVGAAAAWLELPARLAQPARIAGPIALVVAVGAGFAMRSESVQSAAARAAPVLAGPLG